CTLGSGVTRRSTTRRATSSRRSARCWSATRMARRSRGGGAGAGGGWAKPASKSRRSSAARAVTPSPPVTPRPRSCAARPGPGRVLGGEQADGRAERPGGELVVAAPPGQPAEVEVGQGEPGVRLGGPAVGGQGAGLVPGCLPAQAEQVVGVGLAAGAGQQAA